VLVVRYTSPEVSGVGPAADLFSFGVVLAEAVVTYLLSLRPVGPFVASSPMPATSAEVVSLMHLLQERVGSDLCAEDQDHLSVLVEVAQAAAQCRPRDRGLARRHLWQVWTSLQTCMPNGQSPYPSVVTYARAAVGSSALVKGRGIAILLDEAR
jgi:hypothetical protein